MKFTVLSAIITCVLSIQSEFLMAKPTDITIATFNVSMEAENYQPNGPLGPFVLEKQLANGDNRQIKNIAAIIQSTAPDIILLNEFDYIADPSKGVQAFIRNYLQRSQYGQPSLDYRYVYLNTVNTGQPSGFDLNNDGNIDSAREDAWGFGHYPGQYGMVLLSRFPIDIEHVRTFQHFKWKDMPNYLATRKADGSPWYNEKAWQQMPLSSKSHWDVPVMIGKERLHVLVSHPTPPVFDGPEDRNGHRNHDEVRFWLDYISGQGHYIYDDKGQRGGLAEKSRFVILGDLNSSPDEGDAYRGAIVQLSQHALIHATPVPRSTGGKQHSPNSAFADTHTAGWRMRADYVLPSKQGFELLNNGVFWPAPGETFAELVQHRAASSDHRLVYARLRLVPFQAD